MFKQRISKLKKMFKKPKLGRRQKMFLFGGFFVLLLMAATSFLLSWTTDPVDKKYRVQVSVNLSVDATISGVVTCVDVDTGESFTMIYSDSNSISGDTFRFLSSGAYSSNETVTVRVQIGQVPEAVNYWTYDIPIWDDLNDVPSSMFEAFPERGINLLFMVVEA